MNRAEPLSLVEKIMAQHQSIREDGNAAHPNGRHTFCETLADIGWEDCTFEVEWELRGDRVCIDGIEVCTIDGPVMIDPVFGSSLHKALYPRLASIALSKSEDILEAYYDSL